MKRKEIENKINDLISQAFHYEADEIHRKLKKFYELKLSINLLNLIYYKIDIIIDDDNLEGNQIFQSILNLIEL